MAAPSGLSQSSRELEQIARVIYVLEHKMYYILIHAPSSRIVVLWHVSNIPPRISESTFLQYPHVLYSSNIYEI